MRKFVLSLVALLTLLGAFGHAQQGGVNTVPQVGVNTANLRQSTYSAVSIGLVPVAAGATDAFCISGGATKNIAIRRIGISGTATTAVEVPVTILRRTALDTGGTAATGAALPVAGRNNTNNDASTAVLTAYTANPTINDASPKYFRTASIALPLASANIGQFNEWLFGTPIDFYEQGLDIPKNTTQQYCINLNSTAIAGGLLYIEIEWTEQ
jgi:hypothetical protein